MNDKADGLMAQPPQNDELAKLLKKLGYPDGSDGSKPSALLAKAISSAQKRMKKLEEMMPSRPEPPAPEDSTPSKDSVITKKPSTAISTFLPRS